MVLRKGKRWARKGRRLLENRVRRLISPDGSFSQYSINYHRLLIDTLCIVEIWRRWQDLDKFSPLFYQRAKAATDWLFTLVEPTIGDAPNVGGNDGARLLPLTDTGYRDFRPSVQLSMAIFKQQRAYATSGVYDIQLRWLGVSQPESYVEKPISQQFNDGGYAVLRRGTLMAVLKYPRYRFRPRHCDALHVDFWIGPENLLRDGGTYSYNAEPCWQEYFTGSAGHNTIEFDDRDQMPRIGRFLRGEWLNAHDVKFTKDVEDIPIASAGYCDRKGVSHYRNIKLYSNCLVVRDTVSGFVNRAVMRWRLRPGDWKLNGKTASWKNYNIRIRADVPIVRFELTKGWESLYYFKKTLLPVLEIEVQTPGKIVTEFFIQI